VQDIVVFLDHGQGVKDRLQANGYNAHAVLTISEVIETLYQAGRIDEAQRKMFAETQT
jgi:uridine monophosphate synthetase